ncbi:redoxin domain-containing protein [Actinoplanes sp. NBC_00393]|uniref:TlpA family protein disulfide reductase n=1 Tax=Actinoplanes sp. NBC_00393 TaxID=2975953 RepID=UPI002E22A480
MPSTTADAGEAYRFTRFRTALLLDDLTFDRDSPAPGARIPAFDLPTLDGGRFTDTDLGARPVLLVFGSRTCPVTESAGPILNELHRDFGDRVRFVLVNTREAHPGEKFGQPRTPQDKRRHAEELRRHHALQFEVAVDDLDGGLHQAMSPKPNSAYLLDPAGVIRFRAHWANDETGLRAALTAIAAGRVPQRDRSRAMLGPLLRAVGHLPGVVGFAGSRVERDIWLAAAPLAVLSRVSRLFSRLPEDHRGPAAAALTAGVAVLVVALAVAVAR